MSAVTLLRERTEDELRAGIAGTEIPSPHAYVSGIDLEYDLRVLIDGLVEPRDEAADLRIAYGEGEDERWVFAQRLGWDSEFFGRGIGRVDAVVAPGRPTGPRADTTADVRALRAMLDRARELDLKYLTCTATAEQLPLQRALTGAGFQMIETRLAHHGTLDGAPEERFPVRLAGPDDVPSLARAARESVNPFDRFHADVNFPPADADRMMERWVEASVLSGFADAVLVPDEPEPEAFVTIKFHEDQWDGWGIRASQPIIAAILPRHRGWYYRLIAETMHAIRERGGDRIFLVTQITNTAVLRGWQRLGMVHGRGEHVYSITL